MTLDTQAWRLGLYLNPKTVPFTYSLFVEERMKKFSCSASRENPPKQNFKLSRGACRKTRLWVVINEQYSARESETPSAQGEKA